jgi:hypothetical protein
MMEAVRTSETPVDNHFTRQYNPEDSSEHCTYILTGCQELCHFYINYELTVGEKHSLNNKPYLQY